VRALPVIDLDWPGGIPCSENRTGSDFSRPGRGTVGRGRGWRFKVEQRGGGFRRGRPRTVVRLSPVRRGGSLTNRFSCYLFTNVVRASFLEDSTVLFRSRCYLLAPGLLVLRHVGRRFPRDPCPNCALLD